MPTRSSPTRGAAIAVLAAIIGSCSGPRDPIVVQEGMVTVENQTSREWREVLVTVNDHFRGGARTLAAGGRLTAPLSEFQTGFGQRFDRGRMSPYKIEVAAKLADGTPVRLLWEKGMMRESDAGR
jgi:hypothetical protein